MLGHTAALKGCDGIGIMGWLLAVESAACRGGSGDG